jgi:hypothetical protein
VDRGLGRLIFGLFVVKRWRVVSLHSKFLRGVAFNYFYLDLWIYILPVF